MKRLDLPMFLEMARAAAVNDCKAGVYDKWYRYHSDMENVIYDAAWQVQNKITKNETVNFIEVGGLTW